MLQLELDDTIGVQTRNKDYSFQTDVSICFIYIFGTDFGFPEHYFHFLLPASDPRGKISCSLFHK